MGNLLLTMLATSSVDSLNPIGITQQFILQGIVKKPRHIWYFIITTAIVNIIFGYLVYYGVISLMDAFLDDIMSKYSVYLYSIEFALGIIMLIIGICKLINRNKNTDSKEKKEKKPVSVTPLALIGIGIVSTTSELTSAVPYFTFLAVLITYRLPFYVVTGILLLYNVVYVAPFIILFVIYLLSKQKFDAIYVFFKKLFTKLSGIFIPLLVMIIGVFIIFHASGNLF